MSAIASAIANEIARLESRREKIQSVLESNAELRLLEIRQKAAAILNGNNNGPDDVCNKLKSLAEEEAKLLKNIRFKYRNAKKYIRELTEIDFKLLELKGSKLSKFS